MTRNPHPVLLLGILAIGVVLGIVVDRSGPTVIADSAPPVVNQIPNPAAKNGTEPVTKPAAAPRDTVSPKNETASGGLFAPKIDASPPPRSAIAIDATEARYQELDRNFELFQHINHTFELVAKTVAPAVVHIVARKTRDGEDKQLRRYEETGSGVVVADGAKSNRYVLTNNHVIEGTSPSEIYIHLHDGRVMHPTRVWTDAKADIAVLDMGTTDLTAARLGDSDSSAVGTWVLALGSPFGLTHSVSHGIISARGRHEEELQADGVENQDFLQTDAAINPGNSGGPLVNLKGEVIGINTAIASNGGGSEGVGFSIPINLAKWIMRQLLKNGKVSRGAMGVDLADLKPETADELGLKRPRGAKVLAVHPDSPASAAGIEPGDVILRFNGSEISDLNHLINLVSMAPIGAKAAVVVWRNRRSVEIAVVVADRETVLARLPETVDRKLADRPVPIPGEGTLRRPRKPGAPALPKSSSPREANGVELQSIDTAWARKLGLPDSTQGVAIVSIKPASPLAIRLKSFDVVESIDDKPVRSVEELARALEQTDPSNPRRLTLKRKIGESYEKRVIPIP